MTRHPGGKTLVITGAAGEFGKLVSEKAAARGANVVCADIDEDGLKASCFEITVRASGDRYIL
jgi:NAD(P)-dependent dehydrogenase (short-subunit alcohol dehydrogenase family)